jgi:hypothetical protein
MLHQRLKHIKVRTGRVTNFIIQSSMTMNESFDKFNTSRRRTSFRLLEHEEIKNENIKMKKKILDVYK